MLYLGNELDNFDKNVKRRVSRYNSFGSFWKERVDNGLQPTLSHVVRLAFDSDHVDPEESVERLEGDASHLWIFVFEMLQAHGEEVVPVVEEEAFLTHTK